MTITPGRMAPSASRSRGDRSWAVPLALLLLGAFALFTFVEEPAGSRQVDRLGADAARFLGREPLQGPIDSFAEVGGPVFSAAAALLLAAVLTIRGRWLSAMLVLAALGVFTGIEIVLRIRLSAVPWDDIPGLIAQPRGRHLMESAYPSGHVGRTALLGGLLIALLPQRAHLAGALLVLLAGLVMAVQRVHASAHTGSDGVGGLLLGGGLAAIAAALLPLADRLERAVRDRVIAALS